MCRCLAGLQIYTPLAAFCDCYLDTESPKIRMPTVPSAFLFPYSITRASKSHCFPPPSVNATLLHLAAKVFDGVAFEETRPLQLLRVWRILTTHCGGASDELIIFVSQVLHIMLVVSSRCRQTIRTLWTLGLTFTSLTHRFTPSSLPSTYITPGAPPYRKSTNTSWNVAACFSFATFFREVM